jgi:hypothetical protein
MAEKLFDIDPVAKAWTTYEIDGDKVHFRRYWWVPDVEAVLDANARERLAAPKPDPDIRHVARIPDIVQYQWLERGINMLDRNDQKKINQMLSSNEYYKLRIGGGRLA